MLHDFFFFIYIHIQGSSVSVSAVSHQALCLIQRLVECLGLVHGQYGRQLLMCELFADIHGLNLANQDFGIFRNFHACKPGNGSCLLSDNLGIQRAVNQDGLTDLLNLAWL